MFNETTNELLVLGVALDPRDGYKMFNVKSICRLVETFYLEDFTDNEKDILKIKLRHYKEDITNHPEFKNISMISELCETLMRTGKSTIDPLIDILIWVVLTLPISTATVERLFFAMNHIKIDDRNKMEDIFLSDSLVIYTEREIAENVSTDSIIDDFNRGKCRRVPLR
ncbi:hypothetical protein LIER_37814 [Lithospermum erythrorhizon]|uniref:HAT C-terminal dimerisation domain-containing protein n=1 Tax=Lithospermum erythrorhizon TaxID=34254 RepID=A0AAV3PTB8_LITER